MASEKAPPFSLSHSDAPQGWSRQREDSEGTCRVVFTWTGPYKRGTYSLLFFRNGSDEAFDTYESGRCEISCKSARSVAIYIQRHRGMTEEEKGVFTKLARRLVERAAEAYQKYIS